MVPTIVNPIKTTVPGIGGELGMDELGWAEHWGDDLSLTGETADEKQRG